MKRWFETLSGAWVGLISHKLRSFLTILGVVIGVAAVIGLMSVGKGAESAILANFQSLGSNLLFVRPGAPVEAGGVRTQVGTGQTLTREDAEAIAADIPHVVAVAPTLQSSFQLVASGQNMRAQVMGVTADYQVVNNLAVVDGSFITPDEDSRAQKVAVIGANVQTTLFPDGGAVGQSIRMGSTIIHVVGVLQSKGASMTGNADDAVLVPLTTLQQVASRTLTSKGEHVVNSITVSVDDKSQNSFVTSEITALLRERHQITSTDDFNISSLDDLLGSITSAMSTMTLMLGAIAGIPLLVGGIGVMNIMLVSVIERTREIGVRKALGARESDIWGQFLVEAAFLTFIGGVIGILGGWGLSLLVHKLYPALPTLVSLDIVALAVSVSVGIGLFFGFYPAWHASRLNPIEALRAE